MAEASCIQHAFALRLLAASIVKAGKRDMEKRLDEHPSKISMQQYLLLLLLLDQPQGLREASQQMGLEPSTLVPMVDELVRKGFLQRSQDRHDRRRVLLEIMPEGKTLLAHVPAVQEHDAIASGLTVLGKEKTALLLSLLWEFAQCMPSEGILQAHLPEKLQTLSDESSCETAS